MGSSQAVCAVCRPLQDEEEVSGSSPAIVVLEDPDESLSLHSRRSFENDGGCKPTPAKSSASRKATSAKSKARTNKKKDEVEFTSCPICCSQLAKRSIHAAEPVGALTNKGSRVEPNLFHVSCITRMLMHAGSGTFSASRGCQQQQMLIAWGTSPVTRKPVDGFLQMPPIEDRTAWVEFIDWKSEGAVPVEELAGAIGAVFPVDPQALERSICEQWQLTSSDRISTDRIVTEVLPFVESDYDEIKLLRDRQKSLASAVTKMSMLKVKELSQRLLGHHVQTKEGWGGTEYSTLAIELADAAGKGDKVAIDTGVRLLEDVDVGVRRAGQLLLSRVAERGDTYTQDAVSKIANHDSPLVREAAVSVLGTIVSAGDEQLASLLSERLTDGNAAVRAAAAAALGSAPTVSDGSIVKQLVVASKDAEACVRSAALDAMVRIVEPRDRRLMEVLFSALRDRDALVRKTASVCLAKLCGKGDQRAFASVSALMTDPDVSVRKAAVQAMAMLATKGDEGNLKVYVAAQKDKESAVRKVVVHLFRTLVVVGEAKAVHTACSWLKGEPSADVRWGIIETLAVIAEKGDKRAVKAILQQLDETDPYLRWKALKELVKIAKVGDQSTIRKVGHHIAESNSTVRAAALEALGELAHRNDSRTIWSISQYTQDCDPFAKRAADEALHKIKQREPASQFVGCFPKMRKSSTSASGAKIARENDMSTKS